MDSFGTFCNGFDRNVTSHGPAPDLVALHGSASAAPDWNLVYIYELPLPQLPFLLLLA
jgi:hypothetical protein